MQSGREDLILAPRGILRLATFAGLFGLTTATVFGGIRIWDVNARSEITNLPAKTDASTGPLGLAFSPDSRTLAYNENENGAILLWDIASRSITN